MWSRPVGRQRNVVASGCLLTTFNSSSPPGLRQYLEAITANQRVKSPCSSSLPLGMARPELTKLLLQRCLCCSPGTHFPPFSVRISQPHHSPFGSSCTHPTVPCTRHWGSSLCSTSQAPTDPCPRDPLAMSKLLDQHQLSLGREIKILSSGFQDELQRYSDLLYSRSGFLCSFFIDCKDSY